VNALDWIVVAGGIAAISWVNWYFLWAAPRDRATEGDRHG
jgi:hypothetical protein